jgi:hypothetical protein
VAVKVAALPGQIEVGDELAVMVGPLLTVIVIAALFVQLPEAPTTL